MRSIAFYLSIFLFSNIVYGQNFINGSFETTTSSMSCQYNLNNSSFNSMMSSVFGYGAGNELDIIIPGCFNPATPQGQRAVGLAAFPSDEISIPVTPSLVAGQNYSFTFWAYAELSFRSRGDIQVGASTSNSAFGTLLFTGATTGSAWKQFTVNFTAPNNSTHITVRNIPDGIVHWNHVDDFRFVTLLPIQLENFKAALRHREVDLTWNTITEENNDYFSVERSMDGIEWYQIGRIKGAGQSNFLLSYQMTDEFPLNGLNYYRLGQVDFDGNITYSNIEVVENLNDEDGLNIYPNPTANILNISFNNTENVNSVNLFDALGEKVACIISNSKTIDIQHLPAGFYWLKLEMSSGRVLSRKIIKK